ncbi:unnamed protein product [Gongylonema pulchrum]|uniref:CUE domain-containing protein n=1 Tax=Gongylonema pulchrum TaxID=637853 RepID=A0A183E285_9BILA|nr:unnamed protein product [Gongylonema pulchrum]
MSSAAQQYRNEKQFIEEAIAKVREVVHTAPKNDIILALHDFDFDVNKTIQAFCDDGAQSALDAWERPAAGTNKKKNQKKKHKKTKEHRYAAAAVPSTISSAVSAPPSALKPMDETIVAPITNGENTLPLVLLS